MYIFKNRAVRIGDDPIKIKVETLKITYKKFQVCVRRVHLNQNCEGLTAQLINVPMIILQNKQI